DHWHLHADIIPTPPPDTHNTSHQEPTTTDIHAFPVLLPETGISLDTDGMPDLVWMQQGLPQPAPPDSDTIDPALLTAQNRSGDTPQAAPPANEDLENDASVSQGGLHADGLDQGTWSPAPEPTPAPISEPESDTSSVSPPPGIVGPDGIRRFGTDLDAQNYAENVLDSLDHPRGFWNLPEEQNHLFREYSTHDWVYNEILRIPDHQGRQDLLSNWLSQRGTGFALYEMVGLRAVHLQDIQYAYRNRVAPTPKRTPITPDQADIVGRIMNSPDPMHALDNWKSYADTAGTLLQMFGHIPTVTDIEHRAARLDLAFAPALLPESVITHRALRDVTFMERNNPNNPHPQKDPRSLIDTLQTEPGYMSTVFGTSAHVPGWDPRPFHLHLTLPATTRARWMGYNGRHPQERELVLARGTRYHITDVTTDGDGILHLNATVLLPDEQNTPPAPAENTAVSLTGTDWTVATALLPETATNDGPTPTTADTLNTWTHPAEGTGSSGSDHGSEPGESG
ncbi:ADP-ribosyltransferase, partial [Nocardiopsis sp. LOL_012]|uniref:ADP-ribosyltransferase n=1 Tax=Nocardiopsis sp. LOL_012 TaxID=3345409 RepID=UPI003A85FE2C